ncbi:WD40-repeat-containing domain protein [Lipomyces kononenkoae]|uniref:WD40-repeat-containing domain protein n=1 Tax=Lipomyces kononenkoae TaxID=34357 RepID=A0ACC3T9H0_LIPKO
MSDPFFSRKRKRGPARNGRPIKPSPRQEEPSKDIADEEITDPETSDEELQDADTEGSRTTVESDDQSVESDDEEFVNETATEKRRRLAQQYLENLQNELNVAGFDARDVDKDILAARLQEDVAEEQGRLYRFLTPSFVFVRPVRKFLSYKGMLTPTAIAGAENILYTVSKDRTLAKWDATTGKRLRFKRGDHDKEIVCIAVSSDGKFIATGGKDRKINVYSPELGLLKTFTQHRDSVRCLAFRRGTHQLYSGSADRTVKSWSLDALSYVETLFGHQDAINDIAALAQERCITTGSRDRTVRLWKIVEESQLIFRGGGPTSGQKLRFVEGSIDAVAMVDHHIFVTGSDNGTLSLWTLQRKKPAYSVHLAHGLDTQLSPEAYTAEKVQFPTAPKPQPRWITCLTALPYADIVVSGSWNGIKVWRVVAEESERLDVDGVVAGGKRKQYSLDFVAEFKLPGVVNGVTLLENGKDEIRICAAVGRELRGGRWMRRDAKNGVHILTVKKKSV